MSTTTEPSTASASSPEARGQDLVDRLFGSLLSGLELLSVELGRRLGFYEALREHGPIRAAAFAAATDVAERYAREWLEQQAAAGFIEASATPDAALREYSLPAAHVPVFVDEEDPLYFIGGAMALEGAGLTLPAVAEAYRTGEGVSYDRFGPEIRGAIAALNRPGFVHELADWVAAMPDVVDRLEAGGAVLDAGCGSGWSTIALARAFPDARVVGVDLDAPSIADARRNVAEAGLEERIAIVDGNASDESALTSPEGGFALVTVFEALHDMGEPVKALIAFREVLAPGGAVLVADERVGDEFTAPADELDRLNYAFSVLHCLPATMAESTSIANGTVLRAPTVHAWAAEAGFAQSGELPIEHELWRFYRLD
jgi:SAM-dependent methyltransferase